MRPTIGFGLLALVAVVGGACPVAAAQSIPVQSALAQSALAQSAPTDKPQAERVAILRSGRPGKPGPTVVLARSDWEAFLAETRDARVRAAHAATEEAEARLRTAIDETVAAMRAEIPTFVNWRFSFFTTYRLTFTAVSGAITGNSPEAAVRDTVAERFRELVLKPVMVRTRLAQAMDDVVVRAAIQREDFTNERRIALDRLSQDRGQSPADAPVTVILSEADALDLPPLSLLRPALPLTEPTDEVGWLGQREALVLAGRQAARRGVGVVVEPTVLAAAPVSLLETAPFLVSAAAGATVVGAGLALEFVALKLWESTERDALEQEAHGALNRYHAELATVVSPVASALVAGTLGVAP